MSEAISDVVKVERTNTKAPDLASNVPARVRSQ